MKILPRNPVAVLLFLSLLSAAPSVLPAEEAPALKPGDPAPKLFVSRWLNGDPVEQLDKGTTYVIECWATWCGPCRASIPHVSELNTKMKDRKVVIIGLNVWERDVAQVEPFVKQMGEKMNYRVALDTPGEDGKGKTATAWLTAAGRNGIPCAFIVDPAGKIAWIGHPMSGMDKVLERVVEGTFDLQKEAAAAAEWKALEQRLAQAAQKKDPDAIVEVLDAMAKQDPTMAVQLAMVRFEVLFKMKKDYPAAYAHAREAAGSHWKADAMALNNVAWMILDTAGVETRDVDLAMTLAVEADRLTGSSNPVVMDTLARAHAEKGDLPKAIGIVEKALEKTADAGVRKQLTASLEQYKAKQDQAK